MPCFVLKDGTSIHSQTTTRQYQKYIRLIEKGYNTEEAFEMATQIECKPEKPSDFARRKKLQSFKEIRDEANSVMTPDLMKTIRGRMYRTKCSFAEAYQWTKDTGRCCLSFSNTFERNLKKMKVNSYITQLSNAVETLLKYAPEEDGSKVRAKLEECTLAYIEELNEEYEKLDKDLSPYTERSELVSLSVTVRHLKDMLAELQKQPKTITTYVTKSGTYTE